jgi:protein O-mannosyl-transferase
MVTLAVSWPVSRFELVFGDHVYMTDNPNVQAGFTGEGLHWAFCSVHASLWYPLTTLSHTLDCQLFGMNAGGHHLTSLLFHIANMLHRE